jgi:hypothetical protein
MANESPKGSLHSCRITVVAAVRPSGHGATLSSAQALSRQLRRQKMRLAVSAYALTVWTNDRISYGPNFAPVSRAMVSRRHYTSDT